MIKKVLSGRVPVKIWTDDVDAASMTQLKNTAAMPFVYHHVAAMPDVHFGLGATVGSVVATSGAICPAAVGVDIGCGMMVALTDVPSSALDGKLSEIRSAIEAAVPVGFSEHQIPVTGLLDRPYVSTPDEMSRAARQIGTLGGGNHFIEVCIDDNDKIVIMLHSGSRGIGNKTAQKHIEKAKGVMRSMFVDLPDPDLAYFAQGTNEFKDYMNDLRWCQDYAFQNRATIMKLVLYAVKEFIPKERVLAYINCHHNYVAEEFHFGQSVYVTRKGAIRAEKDDLGVIPGSMGAASYIVRGLGNPESFNSAPHGAGRRMSRGAAKRAFTVEDLAVQTAGVECRKDKSILDEIPGAYKPIDEVIADSSDLVEIIAKIKQVICVKG